MRQSGQKRPERPFLLTSDVKASTERECCPLRCRRIRAPSGSRNGRSVTVVCVPDADDVARNLSPREQLLSTASRVFYEEGINAIGVERVLSEAGVTRSTLYRYFDGKMGLVEAYLRREDEVIRGYFSAASLEATSPRHLMELLITGIADDASRYHRRGCPFINAAAEFPESAGPVRKIVSSHRDWFRNALEVALVDMGLADADSRARTLVLLRDAALVGGYLDGVEHVRRTFLAAARREATLD